MLSPYPPAKRLTSTTIPVAARVTNGPTLPITAVSSRVSAPATVFNSQSIGLRYYAVSGAFSGTLALSCPTVATEGEQQVVGSVPLSTFPSPFTLVAGTSGFVIVTSTLAPNVLLPPGVLVGNVSALFLYGANSTPTTGPLTPGVTYTQPTVSVTLTVANIGPASIAGFTFSVVVQAILLGAVVSAQ
jgi:hypothetical protein